jgi:hypothetical protein
MHFRPNLLTALLVTTGLVAGSVLPAMAAKEIFKDEAGRVIYTIDDEDLVSMFENSPTDLTISVTRGTREKMQPRITEVRPESIPAGTTTVLKLKGENLVGATVKMSLPGIEVKPYAGKPKSLDIPLFVSGNTPAGEVTVEVATPIGSTKTSFTVTEFQIGGGGPSRRDSDKQAVSTAAPTSCPEGMVGVAAERGGFCIEIDHSFTADYRKSVQACALKGKRRCDASEWRTACEQAKEGKLPLKNMVGSWEWTGTEFVRDAPGDAADYGASGRLTVIVLGRSDCKTERYYETWKTENMEGRCCK